jgi:hypothetical protein
MDRFGAEPQGPTGTFVRVWAPNAIGVAVTGDFCNWNDARAVPLRRAGGEFWEGLVADLSAGGRYELVLTRDDGSLKHRLDPAARDTDHSARDNRHNKSSVVDTRHFLGSLRRPALRRPHHLPMSRRIVLRTPGRSRCSQRSRFCSQDAWFGGWDGAGNAYHEPWTQPDGKIYVNVPKWSVVMFKLV